MFSSPHNKGHSTLYASDIVNYLLIHCNFNFSFAGRYMSVLHLSVNLGNIQVNPLLLFRHLIIQKVDDTMSQRIFEGRKVQLALAELTYVSIWI